MPECGSQCWLCDLPVRFDTYKGCTHNCAYCFVQRKSSLQVEPGESAESLRSFIAGNRTGTTRWADWDIPIHWGGMSDPFQPCERKYKRSLEALKILAETGYPCVISTKGRLCVEEPYLSLIRAGNIVMQVSAVCDKYDALEPGAPPFAERLEMIRTLSRNAKRVIVRTQPYICDVFEDVKANLAKYAEAGAYGVIFEGMKFNRKKPGTVKVGGDFVIPIRHLRADFERLRDECHRCGLAFYSGENRLRTMGDSMTCCGIDGLEGFRPNTYNLAHILNGDNSSAGGGYDGSRERAVLQNLPSGHGVLQDDSGQQLRGDDSMDGAPPDGARSSRFGPCEGSGIDGEGTARVFHSIFQEAGLSDLFRVMSFRDAMGWMYRRKPEFVLSVLGIKSE